MKYEFVAGDEKVIALGRTVKRIRALVAITAFGVTPGQLGGYIENDKNRVLAEQDDEDRGMEMLAGVMLTIIIGCIVMALLAIGGVFK